MFTSPSESEEKNNRKLIAECLRGQVAAWNEFVVRFTPLISGVIANVAHANQDQTTGLVDDLTQDTFFKLCNKDCRLLRRVTLADDESLYAYLKVVACNLARDYFRANRAAKRGPHSYAGDLDMADRHQAASASPVVSSSEEQVLLVEIDECLEKVTQGETAERDRLVFRLHHYGGFSTREIAKISSIGLTPKGVESLLRRIVASLRSELVAKDTLKLSAKV